VRASNKENHTRDKRNETALFTRASAVTPGQGTRMIAGHVDRKVTYLPTVGKNQQTKPKCHLIGREKTLPKRHN
jgi:hypothetical protein